MNDDHALRSALARADAALPPPPGRIVTAASLHARLRRRRLQHALVATLLLSAGAATFAVLRAPALRGAPPARMPAALRVQLDVELQGLLDRLARLDDADAAIATNMRRGALAGFRAAVAGEQSAIAFQSTGFPSTAFQSTAFPNWTAGRAGNERHR